MCGVCVCVCVRVRVQEGVVYREGTWVCPLIWVATRLWKISGSWARLTWISCASRSKQRREKKLRFSTSISSLSLWREKRNVSLSTTEITHPPSAVGCPPWLPFGEERESLTHHVTVT